LGTKSALHQAIQKGDLESTLLILVAHPDDEFFRDSSEMTPLEIAAGLRDPSFELLILANQKPASVTGEYFLESIKNGICAEMEHSLTVFQSEPTLIPKFAEFLDGVAVIEHSLWKFGELVDLQTIEVRRRLEILQQTAEGTSMNAQEKAMQDLRVTWNKKIKETENRIRELSSTVFTQESLNSIKRWEQITRERKQFLDDLLKSKTITLNANSEVIEEINLLTKQNTILETFQNWNEVKSKPFQKEIVAFTKKSQMAFAPMTKTEELKDIFRAIKEINSQIAESSPNLFESRSTTTTKRSTRARIPKPPK